MSAIDETGVDALVGKSTQDGGRPSVGDATRQLFMLPQLPYADAVHAELVAVAMPPACYEAGVRKGRTGTPELYIRAVWPARSPVLDDRVRELGLTIAWSHVTGWSAHDAEEACQLFNVDVLADPRLIAHAALHLAEEPLTGEAWTPPPSLGRWSEALYLDIALAHFDEQEVTW